VWEIRLTKRFTNARSTSQKERPISGDGQTVPEGGEGDHVTYSGTEGCDRPHGRCRKADFVPNPGRETHAALPWKNDSYSHCNYRKDANGGNPLASIKEGELLPTRGQKSQTCQKCVIWLRSDFLNNPRPRKLTNPERRGKTRGRRQSSRVRNERKVGGKLVSLHTK